MQAPIFSFTVPKELLEQIKGDFPYMQVVSFKSKEEFVSHLAEATLVLVWHFPVEWYEKASNLKAILTPSAGKDWIAQDPKERVVRHFGSYHGKLMAESLLGMILFWNRRFDRIVENQKARLYDRPMQQYLRLFSGQHILIAGYGAIGRYFAKLILPFGCKIKGLQRTHAQGVDKETGVEYIRQADFSEALAWADHVIDILPASKETNDFFAEPQFALMKSSAFFYNLGRGNSVNEGDLIAALEKETIAGAALDVFKEEPLPKESRLWHTKNLFITPHSSCVFYEYMFLYYEEMKKILQSLKDATT